MLKIFLTTLAVSGSIQPYDQKCLAEAIYFESRNQSEIGQMAVAEVIMNRVKSPKYPNRVCAVVTQPHQFSYVWDNQPDVIKNMTAWGKAKNLAWKVLNKCYKELTGGALYYHADYVKPQWASKFKKTASIGNHVFYKES